MVAPGQQGGLELQLRPACLGAEDDVVGRAVLEAVGGDQLEVVVLGSEPEARRVQQVGAEIVQHARAFVAPSRLPHELCRAVAVEQAAAVEPAQAARLHDLPQPHEVRLEAVIIGGVANHALVARQALERRDLIVFRSPERLFDQHVLALADQLGEQRNLRLVGNAAERRVIVGRRHLREVTVICLRQGRVHRCHEVVAGHGTPLAPLDAEADDDYAHRNHAGPRSRSILSSRADTSAGVTGTLPSTSHSPAAAITPRIVACTDEPDTIMARVA